MKKVDLHSHVAGPKVNAGRRSAPQLSRGRTAAVPTIFATGATYAALGYTTVFDAAIATGAAHLAHMELDELPILDKGIYLLAGDDAETAARYANVAAALSTTGYGAVTPMPRAEGVLTVLKRGA
jgi:formylmethanofuran dehydrogenase subunit A